MELTVPIKVEIDEKSLHFLYEQGYMQGRTDAIDEYTEILRPLISELRSALKTNSCAFIDLDLIAEQLKSAK